MVKYEVKPVVCDYGVFENGELKLILDCRSNAETIVNILKAWFRGKRVCSVNEKGI